LCVFVKPSIALEKLMVAPKQIAASTLLQPWQWLSVSKLPAAALLKLLSLIISLVALNLSNAALAVMRQGSAGADVIALQQQLTAAHCYDGPITGYFGSQTLAGVQRCQDQHGLVADGVAGPKTLAVLAGEPQSTPAASQPAAAQPQQPETLQQGSRGQAVTDLQQKLVAQGYYSAAAVDGIFGRRTAQAVAQLQQAHGLPVTQIVSDRERHLLASLPTKSTSQPATPAPAAVLNRNQFSVGDAGKDVERLQQKLKELQYFDASVTGYVGRITQGAIAQFQAAHQLPATGMADASTLLALGLTTRSAGSASGPMTSSNAAESTPVTENSPFSRNAFISSGTGTPLSQANWGSLANPSTSTSPKPQASSLDSTTNPDQSRQPAATTAPAAPTPKAPDYVVLIPQRDGVTLQDVQQLFPDATQGKSSLGQYIQTGRFSVYGQANYQAKILQAYGLDARIAYR
jgi:peptidoglycan hydrolase-like protein with peptidoglycan-binding domain